MNTSSNENQMSNDLVGPPYFIQPLKSNMPIFAMLECYVLSRPVFLRLKEGQPIVIAKIIDNSLYIFSFSCIYGITDSMNIPITSEITQTAIQDLIQLYAEDVDGIIAWDACNFFCGF